MIACLRRNRPASGKSTSAFNMFTGGHFLYEAVKRILDLSGAVTGLLLLSPVLLVASLAIRLESSGPVIFRQKRVGRNGEIFTLYKFRGMYVDARERFPEMYAYRYSPEQLLTLKFHPENDPRVTRVGRFLRRTSIDELPNLWNVVRGEMSLVGPRPEIPEMIQYLGDAKDIVLSVKPGVTSPAKAGGRDRLSYNETVRLDVDYVANRTVWKDIRIIARTALGVVMQDGVA